MKKNNPLSYQFSCLCILLIIVLILIFLDACSEDKVVGSSEMRINVEGTVTYKEDGSPAENVKIQLLTGNYNVLKETTTDQEGKYSISYYGRCSTLEPKTTLIVRIRCSSAPAGFYPEWPISYTLKCTTQTQTFNFQLIPKP
jgi:hypothetical protein